MKSIFLRIFGGVLLALILISTVCVLAVDAINQVRLEQHRMRVAQGTFHLLAEYIGSQPELSGAWLESLSHQLGYTIEVKDINEAKLSSRHKARIEEGQVVFVEDAKLENHYRIYIRLRSSLHMFSRSSNMNSQVVVAHLSQAIESEEDVVYLIKQALGQKPFQELEHTLSKISEDFQYPLVLLEYEKQDANTLELTQPQWSQLMGGKSLRVVSESSSTTTIYSILKEQLPDGQLAILKVGPIPHLEHYPAYLLLFIIIAGLVHIGFVVYLLTSQLEQRLRKLERATSRISRGHLSARVGHQGSDSVGRLGEAFNSMADHIQRLISVQREMIRAVSHELRTPVACIRFAAELLQCTAQSEKDIEKLDDIEKEVQNLDILIDEILTYARLEDGGPMLDFQVKDVDEIIYEVANETRPNKDHITVEQVPSGLALDMREAEVEPRHLQRAVHNLVSNAVGYAESQVRVSYSVNSGICRIDVEDDGCGIPEDEWERVFTPFERLDASRTRKEGKDGRHGYGLGLSIVRRIVYWHGGKAMVGRSALGGAKFTLVWPKKQSGV